MRFFPKPLADTILHPRDVRTDLRSGQPTIELPPPDSTNSLTRTDVVAILNIYDGEITGVSNESGPINVRLHRRDRYYLAEIERAEFEPRSPLTVGQTFAAYWVRFENGSESWLCRPDPISLPSPSEYEAWVARYTERYASGECTGEV
jgi:hypothetical protein